MTERNTIINIFITSTLLFILFTLFFMKIEM
jgi:hypothetical protein